tara:strand:- start:663 stop:1412 length:750 start_codon:yes stop_codon:yes gene_type:complete
MDVYRNPENQNSIEILEASPGFRDICISDREYLFKHSTLEIFNERSSFLKKNGNGSKFIHNQGDNANYVYFVFAGRVREVINNGSKNEGLSVVNLIQDYGWFGIEEFIGEKSQEYYADAESLKRTELLRVPSRMFEEIYEKSSSMKDVVISEIAKLNSFLRFQSSLFNLGDAEKFVQFLRRAVDEYAIETSEGYLLDWKKYEIASLIGTSREAISRQITNLSNEGLLKRLGGSRNFLIDAEKIHELGYR